MGDKSRKGTALSVVPHYVSQHTAPGMLGFSSGRQFIRWIKAEGLTIRRVGHSLLVPLADCVAAIERHAETESAADTTDAPSMAEVMAALGVADA